MHNKVLLSLFLLTHLSLAAQTSLEQGISRLDNGDYAQAIEIFEQLPADLRDTKTAQICYGRALGLNGDPQSALKIFQDLEQTLSDDVEVQLNVAEAYLWDDDYESAISTYVQVLELDPQSFSGLYGYAVAHAGLSDTEVALTYLDKALLIKPADPQALTAMGDVTLHHAWLLYKRGRWQEATSHLDSIDPDFPRIAKVHALRAEIMEAQKTRLHLVTMFSEDNLDNRSTSLGLRASIPFGGYHLLGLQVDKRDLNNLADDKVTQQRFSIHDRIKLGARTQLALGGGLSSERLEGHTNSRYSAHVTVNRSWGDFLYTELTTRHYNLDFLAELAEHNLSMTEVSFLANVSKANGLGFYIKGTSGRQSDDNGRHTINLSLYYTLSAKPLLRVGLNHSQIGYTDSSSDYFSPERFLAAEAFGLISNAKSSSRLQYELSIAGGLQDLGLDRQWTTRGEAKLSYAWTEFLTVSGTFLYNSAASTQVIAPSGHKRVGIMVQAAF